MREPLLPRLPFAPAPFASASERQRPLPCAMWPQTLVKKDIEFVRRIKGEILSE